MKLTIDVTPIQLPPGMEYVSTAYPGPGIYHNQTTLSWVLVYTIAGTNSMCATTVGTGAMPPLGALIQTPTPKTTEGTFDGLMLLKAIAIAQNPQLALDLCK
jgi:hypothetical protein